MNSLEKTSAFLFPSQARTPAAGSFSCKVSPPSTLQIAQPQQVLAAGLESDAHVAFATALVGAIVFAQRLATGAEIDPEPAQDLRTGDGHAP
jgi:hypothetical protein